MCYNGGGGYSLPSVGEEEESPTISPSNLLEVSRLKEVADRLRAYRMKPQQPVAPLGIFAPQVSVLETYRHDQETTRRPGGVVPAYQSRRAYPQAVSASVNPYLPRVG